MKQRGFTFLLTMFISMMSVEAQTIYGISAKNADGVTIRYTYIENSTELTVAESSSKYTGDIVIPSSVTYYGKTFSVTSIGWKAFSGCSGLISVTIPNSVTSIGESAFENSGLTNITMPNSVTSIGESVFQGSKSLMSITIPNSVTSIGRSAFRGCSALTSVTIPNSVTSIVESAFYDCTGLTSVTIPNSVTSIGSEAFEGCSGLTSVTIPNSVTSIGSKAFRGCSGLPSITIPNSVTFIGWQAFSGCSGLTSVTIPNSVTEIGTNAFENCSSLESMTIGTGVLSIGSSIFANHQPAKVIWLTNTPPSGYTYAAGTVNYVANDQYTSLSNKTVYKYLSSLFEVDGVKYVPVSPSERTCDAIDCLYSDGAENIHIGETVTNAGITLKVNRVHPYASYKNQHIKQVKLDLKGDIGNYAFNDCDEVTTASIANAGSVGDYAFYDCDKLATATIANTGAIGNYTFQSCDALQTATLGEKVTGIGQYAFSRCSKLGSIVIPNAVTTIGQYAFQNCISMASVNMGNGVSTIETYTFSGCTSLPTITIPQSVTKMNNHVFSGCKALTDVYIADRSTILTLGSNGSSPLFADCPLDSVYIGGNISYSTSKDKGYSPFYRNTSLRSVTITDEETEISPNEFYGCTNLKNVRIGDGVTTIGNWAFSGCSSLDYFAFGSSVETIGQEAFSDCTAMTNLISHADTPPVCGSQALEDINIWTCKLEVPAGNTAAYAAADQWKEFLFVSEGNINERSFYITYMVDGETYKKEKLKYGASITPEPTPVKEGYKFSGWSDIPKTMPAQHVVVTGTFERYYDVGTVAKVVNFIMNSTATADDLTLYDLNKDGELNIGDVILMVKEILNSGATSRSLSRSGAGDGADLANYTAAQFEIKVADDTDIRSIRLSRRMAQTHQLMYQQTDANTYAVVVYSPSNKLMSSTLNSIVEIETDNTSTDALTIENVTVAKPTGETDSYRALPIMTGILQAERENSPAAIFDLKGNRLDGTKAQRKGIFIINGNKTVVR